MRYNTLILLVSIGLWKANSSGQRCSRRQIVTGHDRIFDDGGELLGRSNECSQLQENNYKDTNYVSSSHIGVRYRRSLWTSFINHINPAIESFHVKPLLAGGINDVDDFAIEFKDRFEDNSKSANVIFKKSAGKEATESVEKYSEKGVTEGNVKEQDSNMLDDKQINDYKREISAINIKNHKALKYQIQLIERIGSHKPTLTREELEEFFINGLFHPDSEKFICRIFESYPEFKKKALVTIQFVRNSRLEVKDRQRVILKKLKKDQKHIPLPVKKLLSDRLKKIHRENTRWLDYLNRDICGEKFV